MIWHLRLGSRGGLLFVEVRGPVGGEYLEDVLVGFDGLGEGALAGCPFALTGSFGELVLEFF